MYNIHSVMFVIRNMKDALSRMKKGPFDVKSSISQTMANYELAPVKFKLTETEFEVLQEYFKPFNISLSDFKTAYCKELGEVYYWRTTGLKDF